ncbi:MAG: hypothetical protein O7I42_02860 [Alphaproteobacteria bacterium]|nr:hypothetical protein [Alphaproteobacteria bacterium]
MTVRFGDVIEIELPNTWPNELRRLLEDNLDLLSMYESERVRIDRFYKESDLARVTPQHNPHEAERDELIERADAMLVDKDILGFHCTRLAEDEATAIRAEGLEPLTPDLLERRIRWRAEAGELTSEQAEALIAEHQGAQEGRLDTTWFIHSRSILRVEGAVYRLFRSWGGEAMYWGHENHSGIGPALRAIGQPCIVVAAVPVANIQSFNSMGEWFVTTFLAQHGVETRIRPDVEGHVREPVGAGSIKALIFHGEETFEELTGCSDWDRSFA